MREAKEVAAHRVYFTERAGPFFNFFPVIKNPIPIENKSANVLQLRFEFAVRGEEFTSNTGEYFFDVVQIRTRITRIERINADKKCKGKLNRIACIPIDSISVTNHFSNPGYPASPPAYPSS